ncbi:hypothetical protein JD844_019856, partial [Phrynosoma platyrhinos]
SDWPTELRGANGSQKIMNITSSFANQLLLVSMLEHLCHVYAQDPTRSRLLFQLLCKTFTQMHLLSDFAVCEEFSSLRLQHNRAIAALMKAANKQILSEEFANGNSCTNRESILFEAQTSRYINEFDEVLREVKVLAGLQHPNIVGYHTAWMEHVQPTCLKGEYNMSTLWLPVSFATFCESNLNLPSLKMSSEQENSVNLYCDKDMEDSSSIIFADLNPEDSVGRSPERNGVNAHTLSDLHENSCLNDTTSGSGYNRNLPSVVPHCNQNSHSMNTKESYSEEECSQKGMSLQQQCQMEYHLMLHIQMQLCEISLCDWIVDRNKRCFRGEDTSSPYHHIDNHGTLKIFQELLEGVYYIHSMGVMHRDIKPRNIFLHGSDYHVKIGDFGLACRDIIQEDTIHLLSAKKITELIHTSGVGTCLYASPEQLQGSHYDFKSDMYSLGVILFELFQPFGTEMERTKVICCLQQKVIQQEEEIKLLKERVKLLLQEKEERHRIKELGSPV